MPNSMTGFARVEAQHGWGSLTCELRSVNHRYLEVSLRLPETLRILETQLRDKLRKNLSRGKVEVSLSIKMDSQEAVGIALDEALAIQVLSLAAEIEKKLSNPAPPSALDVLRWPGVIKVAEVDQDLLKTQALDAFSQALKQLRDNRQREGSELKLVVEQKLEAILQHVGMVKTILPNVLQRYTDKLRARLLALEVDVDEQRFNQELVYVAQKADVAEELDRIEAHLAEVKLTLERSGPAGRRLDFLMQELNREANTLSSKSLSSEISQTAVELKVLIEQIREQVQNIE